MPVYRIRKNASASPYDLAKAGGNAPDTAGVVVVPFAQSKAVSRSGGAGVLSFSSDGSTTQDIFDGLWRTKASLTNSSANGLFTITVPSGDFVSGNIEYSLEVSDGTDYQVISSFVTYSAVNKAGTLTETITEVSGNQAKAVSGGTLTTSWTVTAASNVITINLTPTSSLTPTTCRVNFFVSPFRGAITLL